MWDMIWYLGFPIFVVSVFGSPYKKYYDELDKGSPYNADQFDIIYDQRQNGTENYKFEVDGLSLVWSSNSLLAAAALLEPALYGEYPETNVEVILGPEVGKPDEQPVFKPQPEEKPQGNKPSPEKSEKLGENRITENLEPPSQTIVVIDRNHQASEQKPENTGVATNSKMKLGIPGLLRPLLRKLASQPVLPLKVSQQEE